MDLLLIRFKYWLNSSEQVATHAIDNCVRDHRVDPPCFTTERFPIFPIQLSDDNSFICIT